MKSTPPKAFISYSHDTIKHQERVLGLADRLRGDGIDAEIDQYNAAPPEGWPLWCERQISSADVVLMVCTETYHRRVSGDEEQGKGLGVVWEAQIIRVFLYDAGASVGDKFVPVLFSDASPEHIPTSIKGGTRYVIDTENGYEDLYRRLTGQPRQGRPPLGTIRALPTRRRQWPEGTMAPAELSELSQEKLRAVVTHVPIFSRETCFVITQLSADTSSPLLTTIDKALQDTGLRSDRTDVNLEDAQWFPTLCNKLAASKIVAAICVADESGRVHSNVMFAIGMALAWEKPLLVIWSGPTEHIPADLQHLTSRIVYCPRCISPDIARELTHNLHALNNNAYDAKAQPTRGGFFLDGAQCLFTYPQYWRSFRDVFGFCLALQSHISELTIECANIEEKLRKLRDDVDVGKDFVDVIIDLRGSLKRLEQQILQITTDTSRFRDKEAIITTIRSMINQTASVDLHNVAGYNQAPNFTINIYDYAQKVAGPCHRKEDLSYIQKFNLKLVNVLESPAFRMEDYARLRAAFLDISETLSKMSTDATALLRCFFNIMLQERRYP